MKITIAVNNFWKTLHHRCLTVFWICLGFWFELPGFWICWDYTGFQICLNNFWICLNMPKYARICLNLTEWLLFYFRIVIPCLLERVVTYFNVYTKPEIIVCVFLRRQNLIFYMVAESILFVFCFRVNKISDYII